MNSLICSCPAPASLTAIPAQNCKFTLSQIARFGIYRTGYQRFDDLNATVPGTAGLPNPPGDQQAMLLADWQTYVSATDNSKIVLTPLVGGNPTMTPGEAQTYGGNSNATLNGKAITLGFSDASFSAEFHMLSPEVVEAFSKLACETDLSVYLLLVTGEIVGYKGIMNGNTPPAPTIEGIPLTSFQFNAGVDYQGIGDINKHTLTLNVPNDWFANAIKFKPTWNPLTQL